MTEPVAGSSPAAPGPAPAGPRRLRGSSTVWLISHLAVFGLAVYAFSRVFAGGHVVDYLAWFVGAALLHDLVLLPLYSALDRVLGSALAPRRAPVVINHIRVPALLSGLLLLVYFPLIFGLSRRTYMNATGHAPAGYLRNWLLITAALFVLSAAIRLLRLRARR